MDQEFEIIVIQVKYMRSFVLHGLKVKMQYKVFNSY